MLIGREKLVRHCFSPSSANIQNVVAKKGAIIWDHLHGCCAVLNNTFQIIKNMSLKQATRTVKNVVKGYSDLEIKVRLATCNDTVSEKYSQRDPTNIPLF